MFSCWVWMCSHQLRDEPFTTCLGLCTTNINISWQNYRHTTVMWILQSGHLSSVQLKTLNTKFKRVTNLNQKKAKQEQKCLTDDWFFRHSDSSCICARWPLFWQHIQDKWQVGHKRWKQKRKMSAQVTDAHKQLFCPDMTEAHTSYL